MNASKPMLPGAVIAVCIIAILLGGFVILMGLMTGVSLLFQNTFNAMAFGGAGNVANQEAMQTFQAATRQGMYLALPALILQAFLATLLIWSAIGVFRQQQGAASNLRKYLFWLIVLEVLGFVIAVVNTVLMMEPTRVFYEAVAPQMSAMVSTMTGVGIAGAAVWAGVKIVYAVLARRVLTQVA